MIFLNNIYVPTYLFINIILWIHIYIINIILYSNLKRAINFEATCFIVFPEFYPKLNSVKLDDLGVSA